MRYIEEGKNEKAMEEGEREKESGRARAYKNMNWDLNIARVT